MTSASTKTIKPLQVGADFNLDNWPVIKTAYDYWDMKRGDRFAPTLPEFRLSDLAFDIIPKVMILDTHDAGKTFTVRFWGSRLVEVYGVELTGHTISESSVYPFMENCWLQCQELVETQQPNAYVLHLKSKTRSNINLGVLRVPISSDGIHVDGVVTIDDFAGNPKTFNDYFEQLNKV